MGKAPLGLLGLVLVEIKFWLIEATVSIFLVSHIPQDRLFVHATSFSNHALVLSPAPKGLSPEREPYFISGPDGSVRTSSGPRPEAVGLEKTKACAPADLFQNCMASATKDRKEFV